MNQNSVINFFTEGCKNSGNLGWQAARFTSQDEQLSTFHRLCLLPKIGKASILDVGCGQGDLYGFLTDAGFQGEYTGIDLTPAMIEIAKKKYPKANFKLADIFGFTGKYDYVIAAGCFNVKFSDNQTNFVKTAMKIMFDLSTKGVNMTLLSSYGYEVAKSYEALVCYEPGEIVQHALSITPSVVMDHNSLPAEFVLTLYH